MPGLDSGLDTGPDQDPFSPTPDDTNNTTPPPRTNYAIREVLNGLLCDLILTYGVPAINTALGDLEVSSGTTAPSFGDSSVINGEITPTSNPVICIVPAGFRVDRMAGFFNKTLTTQIKVKTTTVADNEPEDFCQFFSVIEDVLTDLLTSFASDTLLPINPDTGDRMLPTGLAFQDCFLTGGSPITFPGIGEDRVTRYRGWIFQHRAEINFGRLRPDALGLSS